MSAQVSPPLRLTSSFTHIFLVLIFDESSQLLSCFILLFDPVAPSPSAPQAAFSSLGIGPSGERTPLNCIQSGRTARRVRPIWGKGPRPKGALLPPVQALAVLRGSSCWLRSGSSLSPLFSLLLSSLLVLVRGDV